MSKIPSLNKVDKYNKEQSSTKIIFFRPSMSEKSPRCNFSNDYNKTIESDKKISF